MLNIGDKVMVPRTGGGESPGEIIELYTTHARVMFAVGDTYNGNPVPDKFRGCNGYKTIRQDLLKPIKED